MTVMLFNKTSIYLNLESKVSYLTYKRSDKYKKTLINGIFQASVQVCGLRNLEE